MQTHFWCISNIQRFNSIGTIILYFCWFSIYVCLVTNMDQNISLNENITVVCCRSGVWGKGLMPFSRYFIMDEDSQNEIQIANVLRTYYHCSSMTFYAKAKPFPTCRSISTIWADNIWKWWANSPLVAIFSILFNNFKFFNRDFLYFNYPTKYFQSRPLQICCMPLKL